MAIAYSLVFCLLTVVGSIAGAAPLNRSSFPPGFIFGAASSAYQYAGAAKKDGRGPSVWDTFTKEHPERIIDRSNGDVAVDFYHRYKGDVSLMKNIGLDAFRFSISWSRVLPRGKVGGGVNQIGVEFYNNLINELLSNGIQPFVTLFHWDLPQALEDEYGGFLSPSIVNDYHAYVDFCFKTFGNRVKHWITFNEPYVYTIAGYDSGVFPPSRCSSYSGNCTAGNSATEPYLVAHHILLSHATAVKLYKEKYQAYQKGTIGVTLVSNWLVPLSKTEANRKATSRSLDFMLGWFIHPITYGYYPKSMRAFVQNRLPQFSEAQSKLLKGSFDFLGVNYYSANYVENSLVFNNVNRSYSTDKHANFSYMKNGKPIGTPTDLNWLYIYPKGIRKLMLYIKEKYKNPPIYITENGFGDLNKSSLSIKEVLKDSLRITYYRGHLSHLSQAINEGVNVRGYFAWSFLDDFEWNSGFTVRFGLYYVDYKHGLKRYPKSSAIWFKKFLKRTSSS